METNNPQTAMQQALLSRASYGGAVPAGWSILASRKLANGFEATAYRNQATNEIAVVYTGTDGSSDFPSNINLTLQKMPEQYPDAVKFYQDVKDEYGYVSMVSGHSLGGALAQLVGAIQNAVTYAFNAPGVYGILPEVYAAEKPDDPLPPAESFTKINNYYMAMDPAKAVGTQLGNTTSYDPSIVEAATIIFSNLIPTVGSILSAYGVVQQHAIDRLIEAIAAPRPVDMIDGYRYDDQAKEWSRAGTDGMTEYADPDTATTLSSIREQRVTYNTKITEAAALATDFFRMSNVVDTLSRDYGAPLDLHRQNDPNSAVYFLVNADGDIVAEVHRYDDESALITTLDGRNIAVSNTATRTGFGTALYNAVNQYGGPLIDALSLVRAIQTGNPLPIATSGLRLASAIDRLDGRVDFQTLGGVANVASGVLSILSLEQALQRGDALAAVTAGANAVSFGAQAYAALVKDQVGKDALVNAFGADSALVTLNKTLPYLSAINSLAHGDSLGAAVAVADIALMNAGAMSVPYLGQAYAIYTIVSSLFDDDSPPEPWGNASATWSDFNVVASAVGEHGGLETAQGTMNQFIATLNQLATQQQATNPASPIGIVANRLPSLSYRNYTGYALTDIDAVTGVQRNPEVRYDLTGRPYNAPPGTEQSSQSLGERFVRVALARGAIAPLWEAQTAAIQTQQGDPQAGLTEEERAGRNGRIAGPVAGIEQLWRPVALDLDGDGVQTTGSNKTAAFDVDDSGFLKNTAWLNGGDGFLTLDRNLNGQIDSGRELFSNATLALGARGLAGMRWIDANYDGRIDAADPVWNELRVWRDANGDGVEGGGEKLRLSALGITRLNYTMGTFERDGQLRQLASPDLTADTSGARTHVVPEGIVVETTEGRISLLVTRVDDRGAIEANRDGVVTYEDTEAIISTGDLLVNDTLGGTPGQGLTVTSVADFNHGTGYLDANGFVHYTPEANYYGAASFTYTVQDGTGQAGAATVDLTIQNVNDTPTATVDQHLRAIYGYQGVEYDESGNPVYLQPAYEPYTGVDYSTFSVGLHDTPITYEDSDGPNNATIVVSDIDDPSGPFTFEIAQQAQQGQGVVYTDGRVEYINWIGPNAPGSDLDESGGPIEPDPFVVRVADPHGASTTITVQSQHAGYYNPNLGSGGGGGKPVSIDLDGNGFRFTDVNDSNVFFDINGDGWKNRMAWPSAGDGLLAQDIDGDGKIDQANEISFASYKADAQTDLEALQAFDTNADGVLNAADEKWSRFGIWRDANQNGITDEGEFRTLDEMGVASVSLASDGQFSVIDGQTVHGLGTVTMTDGSMSQLADVTLAYSSEVLVAGQDGTSAIVRKAAFSEPGEVLEGTAENDLIIGKTADNVIYAHEGDDVVFEDGGNDAIDAGAGNDTVYSGADADIVIGGDGDDVVFAGRGNDLMLVGDGHDALFGEGGNDIGFGGDGNDLLYGGEGNDVLSGDRGDDQVYGGTGNDALFGGVGDDVLAGMEGYDLLYGGEGNDLLDGGSDDDTMYGGSGDDTYVVDSANDLVSEQPGEGVDTVRTARSYVLGANVENLTLSGAESTAGAGNALHNVITGNSGNNELSGAEGNDTLNGGVGADLMAGGVGDDIYVVDNAGDVVREYADDGNDTVRSSRSYALGDHVENLILTGFGSVDGSGNALDNTLTGNRADNVLDGGAGADTMSGGLGSDTYVVDDVGDRVVEAADAGYDMVRTGLSYTLGANIEALVLTGEDSINGTGNDLNNVLTGNASSNVLDGGMGADRMAGGSGDDTYIVDHADDAVTESTGEGNDSIQSSVSYVLPENVEALTLTGAADLNATGNTLDNIAIGNTGDNAIDGAAGADTMAGGAGNDTYFVDNALDRIIEDLGEGMDTVIAAVNHALAANAEALILAGAATEGAGNELSNTVTGNDLGNRLFGLGGSDDLRGGAGSDTLDGGDRADRMTGGTGDDTYVVDDADDIVVEFLDQGYDVVLSQVSYTLADNVERLELTGAADTSGTGNAMNNVIVGNSGNNVIDGGPGKDSMRGGAGDDIYVVDDAADSVVEGTGDGADRALASVSYALSDNVEILTLSGTGSIDGVGNGLNNVLHGNDENNRLDGGAGADAMNGGAGDDTYVVDEAADVIIESTQQGYDAVYSSVSYALPEHVEALMLTGTADVNATGNALDNTLTGNSGNNAIDGGAGADRMAGGVGDDIYRVDDAADVVIEDSGEGHDTVIAGVDYALGANVEALVLVDGAASGTGNNLDNTLTANDLGNRLFGLGGSDDLRGGAGSDTLDGGVGDDVMAGSEGGDLYIVDSANDRIVEREGEGEDRVVAGVDHVLALNVEDLTLTGAAVTGTGNALNNTIVGNASDNMLLGELGNDALLAGAGDDILDGGAGADRLTGGAGDDTYIVDDVGDLVIEQAEQGYDTVRADISYTLTDNVERLELAGTANAAGTGNALDNVLMGNAGNNALDGAAGVDTMIGGAGDDTYVVDDAADAITEYFAEGHDSVYSSISHVLPEHVEVLTLTGAANVNATGNALGNTLTGNSGKNMIDGGADADVMAGGTGDDTYAVTELGDIVIEQAGEGYDTVNAAISYILTDDVERLVLTGAADTTGRGNTLDNVLMGNAGNNALDGGAGADTMIGGAGDDTYFVDNPADRIVENAGEGLDTAIATVNHALAANIEALILAGAATEGSGNELDNTLTANVLGNRLFGLGGDDQLRGGDGNDLLDGGTGADRMAGGLGDDTYVVDHSGDVDIERVGEGLDTVLSSASYTLSADVENIRLTGGQDLNATGNALANVVIGNSGHNMLDGGAGADSMRGGAGDDEYVVDDVADTIVELSGEGRDSVYSSVSYVLPEHVEALTLTGAADIHGTGNVLDNTLAGNTGDNVLDGGAGVDVMAGGAGNDVYVVDDSSDRIVEAPDEGHDAVLASASYVLSEHVEDLNLADAADIDGTGNALDNVIIGNVGASRLEGRDGNDTLTGGLGDDALDGGNGDDVYVYKIGDGLDTITDVSGTDSVRFGAGLSLANVALRVRADNGVSIAQVRVLDAGGCEQPDQGFDFALDSDPYGAIASPIEHFVFADGSVRTWNELLIRQVTTSGDSRTLSITTGRNDDTIFSGPRSEVIYAGTGNDIVYGSSGADTVYGEGGDDYLAGGTVSDTLDGGCGMNVLDGRQGNDTLVVTRDGSALLGGNGFDSLRSAAGADFVAGGKQDDTIDAGAGSNVVAFNATDGRDVMLPSSGARNTLSLGVNVDPGKLYLRKLEGDLRLDVNDDNGVTFRNWYSSAGDQTFATLQIFSGAWGAQTTVNPRVATYDFKALVARFNDARAVNPMLDRWSVMNGLLESHLASSDSAALGGDLAAAYAERGDLAGMNLAAAQDVLRSPQFGAEAQMLRPWQQISGETVRLS